MFTKSATGSAKRPDAPTPAAGKVGVAPDQLKAHQKAGKDKLAVVLKGLKNAKPKG